MTFKYINIIIFAVIICFTDAINFSKISSHILISKSDPPFPTPSPLAVECFESILDEISECRNDALKHWNITEKSPIKDLCCAQWDAIDCDLSAAKTKCSSEDVNEVNKYVEQLIEYYDSTKCQDYPKGSSHCLVPMLTSRSPNPPPTPSPLVIDCIARINWVTIKYCRISAIRKWHIRKRSPIRNICCATWDDLDCLSPVVPFSCPSPGEVNITLKYFQQIETWGGKGACSQAAYHSSNCSNASIAQIKSEFDPFVIFPGSLEKEETSRVNKDYTYFLLDYMQSAFPYLLQLMILLAIILATVVVIQFFILFRQSKHERILAEIIPRNHDYHKLDA